MSNPLIIPGDGDELYDVTAAASYLGMAVSTLRSHQYQDKKRIDLDAGPEVPKPENPDDVAIQLPEGAGTEWAHIIEELMLRAGGAGRPVRLWSLRKLDAYLAVTSDPEVRIEQARVHTHSTLDQVKAKRATSGGIKLEESGNPLEVDAMPYGETYQQSTTHADGTVEFGPSLRPLTRGGVGGPVIGTAKVIEDEHGVYAEMAVTDPEAAEALKPDIRPGDIGVAPKLTAREVLERARRAREGR